MGEIAIGIDVGGTFTDFVMIGPESGQVRRNKCLTTPADPSEGILTGLDELLQRTSVRPNQVTRIVHGTTLVANALIERKGVTTGLLTTEGFRDALEIGTELRYDIWSVSMDRAEPLIPRELRFEVRERLDALGGVIVPLDVDMLTTAVDALVAAGVESIAVALLHAYTNDEHERLVEQAIRDRAPSVYVSLSSHVSPEIREYERTSTTAANAYVQPIVDRYLRRLSDKLRSAGYTCEPSLMLSGGGITSIDVAARLPIRLVESGPAGGAVTASRIATATARRNAIAFDMGGTTAKLCVVEDGRPTLAHSFEVARLERFKRGSGLPLQVPTVELVEIGAGGGSIANVNRLGLLKVGPESAGASPGPACYGFGGMEPTVTDANLVLGYLNPDYFLGGDLRLDAGAARTAVHDGVASQLSIDDVKACAGIHSIVTENMAAATRVHAAERGRDPRKHTLIAFGGAAPVHACRMARLLGIGEVIVPIGAGTASAYGMVIAVPAIDLVRSAPGRLDRVDWNAVDVMLGDMENEGRELLRGSGDIESIVFEVSADMRYLGQGYELQVRIPRNVLDSRDGAEVQRRFYETYQRYFESHLEDVAVEVLSWRMTASLPQLANGDSSAALEYVEHIATPHNTREAYFEEADGFVPASVYDRYTLSPGAVVHGPALVEERESTTVILPDAVGRVDAHGNLVISLDPPSQG